MFSDVPNNRKPLSRSKIQRMIDNQYESIQTQAISGDETTVAWRIAAIVLAAGQSERIGPNNKLLEDINGLPMVRRVVEQIQAASVDDLIVVTGHEYEQIQNALIGTRVNIVFNADYALGLSASLRAGLGALRHDTDAAIICLGDMPGVRSGHLNQLIAAVEPGTKRAICVPIRHRQQGNPVLFTRAFFAEMMNISGDTGARHLLRKYRKFVTEVSITDAAVLLDIDTRSDLARWRAGQ